MTDPVILCRDELRFGSTNLGPEAMVRVRASAAAHLAELSQGSLRSIETCLYGRVRRCVGGNDRVSLNAD